MLVRDVPNSYSVRLIFALSADFMSQSVQVTHLHYTIFFIIFSRWFYSNLCSLPLTSTTYTTMPSEHRIRMNIGYRERVWGARRDKGNQCYQVVVACSYNSRRVIRLKWCSRWGLKHHEKPTSYISKPR